MNNYACDFETNNYEEDCRVWSYGIYDFYKDEYFDGTLLDDFMKKILSDNNIIYFHNLKFDGSFILNWLFQKNFIWINEGKLKNKTFKTLITDMGAWYQIRIKYKKFTITIYDSSKIIPSSLKQIAKDYGFNDKGEIDYDKYREIDYEPTAEEKEYQKTDCIILGKAIKYQIEKGNTKMTAASNALQNYKTIIGEKRFEKIFPILAPEIDEFLRNANKAGWCYVNPNYQNKKLGEGCVYDVNSEYPAMARYRLLPYGDPKYFEGEYEYDPLYPLYIVKLKCCFELRKNRLPNIQIKKSHRFCETEYLKSSDGNIVELTLSSVELELFLQQYKVTRLVFFGGYKFKAAYGMFDEYIDYWVSEKNEATLKNDKSKRSLSKLMLNSLIGKFAKRNKGRVKRPYLSEGVLKFETLDEEPQKSLYLPVAIFVWAYARSYIINIAQKNYKNFAYCDTDSIHLVGTKELIGAEIDPVKLGALKKEKDFIRAKFLHAKCYVEELEDGTLSVVCAGMGEKLHEKVSFDNFKENAIFKGKLQLTQVVNGAILKKIDFTIKNIK